MFEYFKREIKLFLIVAVVSAVLAVGGIFLLKTTQPVPVAETLSSTPSPQPQTTEGWQTYRNDEFGFEVKYPPGFRVSDSGGYIPPYHLPIALFVLERSGYEDPIEQYAQGAVFSVSTSNDAVNCYVFDNETLTETQNISSVIYRVGQLSGAGLGHSIGGTIYRTIKDNRCFEISSAIQTSMGSGQDLSKLTDAEIKQAADARRSDEQQLQMELAQILGTFRFVEAEQDLALYSTINDFICKIDDREKDLTDPTNAVVVESRQRIINLGVSGRYFDEHFELVCAKVLRSGNATEVTWRYNVGDFTVGVSDLVSQSPNLALENRVGQLHEMQNVLTKREVLDIMNSCAGEVTNPSIVFGLIADLPTSNQAGLYIAARPTHETRSGFYETAFVNVETGVCEVVERTIPPPPPGG